MVRFQNIFLIGPVGAGKSTIGRQLANELKMDFYDSDRVIEERCGVDIDWIFDIEGEEGFKKREKEVLDELANQQNIVLATGGGAVEEVYNRTLLSSRGKVVYLKATIDQQLERTAKDKRRPQLQVVNKHDQLIRLMEGREPLYEEIADVVIETSETTIRNVVQRIVRKLMEDAR